MKEKPQVTKFDQEIIDAYEGFIVEVYKACNFTKGGSGKKHEGVFDVLMPLINEIEKDMWRKIEKAMDK